MKKIFYLLLIVFTASASAISVSAVTINTGIPGLPTNATGPGDFVNAFYKYALWLGGILAFGAVVYGGVKYILAAGNPSGQSEGKDWIKSALLGLLLLGAAYLVLYIVNPNLVNLTLPSLSSVSVSSEAVPTSAPCNASNPYGYCSSGTCLNGQCGGPNVAGNSVYGCIAPNGYLACTNNTQSNYSGTANPCSSTTCQGLTRQGCFPVSSVCGQSANLTYACIADNGNYACSPNYRSDCSDSVGCGTKYGTGCERVSPSQCGQLSDAVSQSTALSSGCEETSGQFQCVNTGNCATITSCVSGNFGCKNYSTTNCDAGGENINVIQVTYACVAPGDGKYACTNPATDSTCNSAQGCNGAPCIQIQKTQCGQLAK